jgi:hypothetical protein
MKEVYKMNTGNNRKLFIGLGIGVTFAVVVESAIAWGFVGATASMGALGLIALTGVIVYASVKVLLRSIKFRRIKRLLSNNPYTECSDGDYLQHANTHKSPGGKLISEKDKRLIIENIDEFMSELRIEQNKKSATAKPITEKDKRMIMEHIDELMVPGFEYGGERPS